MGSVDSKETYQVTANRINFINSNIYDGEISKAKANGTGTMRYHRGIFVTYTGQWINGERHGYGEALFRDGREYTGEWKNDKIDGWGRMTIRRSLCYTGHFKDNFPNGNGRMVNANGCSKEGIFINGILYEGKMTLSDGTSYEGIFKEYLLDDIAVDVSLGEDRYINLVGHCHQVKPTHVIVHTCGYYHYSVVPFDDCDVYKGDWKLIERVNSV